jgi:hypothetical protein
MSLGKKPENMSYDDLEAKVETLTPADQKEVKEVKEVLEKRGQIQNHEDLKFVLEHEVSHEGIENMVRYITLAMEHNNFRDVNDATEFGQDGKKRPDFDSGDRDGPDIFFKRIYKEPADRTWYEKARDKVLFREPRKIETDEVLLVVSLNNYDKKLDEEIVELTRQLQEAATNGNADEEKSLRAKITGVKGQIASQNTIITALVKHEDGVPQLGA